MTPNTDFGFLGNIRSALKWGILVGGILLLLFLANWIAHIYTDLLWFGNMDYRSVFTTILSTRIWLFVAGALAFAIIGGINIFVTYKLGGGPEVNPMSGDSFQLFTTLLRLGSLTAILVGSIAFGILLSGRWETFLGFLNSTSFSLTDPQFNRDIEFYVFRLPIFHFVQSWLIAALVVSLALSIGMYFLHFSLRGAVFTLTKPVRAHISILGILILLLFALGYYLKIFDLVFSPGGAVVGATYADVHARVNAFRIIIAVIFVGAGLLTFNMFGGLGTRLMIAAVGLCVGGAILIGLVYPNVIQRVVVNPNELRREAPFIERNIEFTRAAFALDRIEAKDYPLATDEAISAEMIEANQETVNDVRLWDHRPFRSILNQIQFFRLYYTFPNVDVDRYVVNQDGETRLRQVMLGTRELDSANLPEEAQSWINRKLQFTHGYGAVVSPVTEFTQEGSPIFFVKDMPPTQDIIPLERPEVYYGEISENFVIVNSNQPELDFAPTSGEPVYTSYQGDGGVTLSGFLRRVVYAWQFRDVNILISGEINSKSKIQYHRQIQQRVQKLAPFLRLDSDPYIVLDQGRLFWIQDAYTVTKQFPYSTPLNLEGEKINYIRNSVKVVIDAYSGHPTLYVTEASDPLVQTYQKIFPELFKGLNEMPPGLRSHIRYPQDLMGIQSRQYLIYHMTDPTEFFNKEDQWSIPNEYLQGAFEEMQPYFLNMRLPGEETLEFVQLLPFTPANKENMVAWLAARSDGENYGKLIAYAFPKGVTIFGPAQVEARISNDQDIKQFFALVCTGEASCIRGNLLVIPMEDDSGNKQILYAEPLYLQATGLAFPELKKVILADSNDVVMEDTLEQAIASLTKSSAPLLSRQEKPEVTVETGKSKLEIALSNLVEALGSLKEQYTSLEKAVSEIQEATEGSSK